MTVVRWIFDDVAGGESYTFHINPNDGGSPSYKKSITQQSTAAADGGVLLFEGRDEPGTFEFSGTILVKEHYDAFVSWWQLRRQIRVTDDFGRQTWIYLTEFEPRRVRSRIYPWKHTFTVRAVVIETVVELP